MLTKTIKYTDYNGVVREEKFLFNLTKAELMEMQYGTQGGLADIIKKIIETQDVNAIMSMFKEIILKAYGEKSADGKRFIKKASDGHLLADDFAQSEAYSELYMELVGDSNKAAEFINGIIPQDIQIDEKDIPEDIRELQLKVLNAGNANSDTSNK